MCVCLVCKCVCVCIRVFVSYTFDELPYILGHKSYACLKWPQMKLWTNAQGGAIQTVKGREGRLRSDRERERERKKLQSESIEEDIKLYVNNAAYA